MNRIRLKCRCGAEAEFEAEAEYPAWVQARTAAWLEHHNACPQMLETFRSPVPAVATSGETLPCDHDWQHDTAGTHCAKCGLRPLSVPSFSISGNADVVTRGEG